MFPGFELLHRLDASMGNRPFIGSADVSVKDGFALARAELRPSTPLTIKWSMGRRQPQDVVVMNIAVLDVVSARVVQVLEEEGFKGWRTFPVDLRGAAGEVLPGYRGLAIYGRCGPIQRERAVPVKKVYPGGVFTELQGYYFDENTWDGSDLFMSQDGTAHVFAVERVKQAFERAKIRGFKFERLHLARLPL